LNVSGLSRYFLSSAKNGKNRKHLFRLNPLF